MSEPAILFKNVSRHFGEVKAVDNVQLEVKDGEFFSMLGPSGSGKTTCLRMIAGFDRPTAGQIFLYGQDVSNLPPYERPVNTVFQDYALFPHMSIQDNIAYGLMIKGISKAERTKKVDEMLHLVRLPEFGNRKPSQLSGGQRQRVALARALINHPKVLLLDEPLGALDLKLRQQMQVELKNIQREVGITFIFVTHDQEEAFEVADKIVVMNQGRIEQTGTPADIFEHPANAFVMDFLGNVNVFQAQLKDGRLLLGNVEMPIGNAKVVQTGSGKADVYVRPHELDLDRYSSTNSIRGKVVHVNPAGSVVKVRVRSDDFGLVMNIDLTPDRYRLLQLMIGEVVYVSPKTGMVFGGDYEI